tara:strand:+ start:4289 stop:5158 length:870 start_codon:yes stop_codon:yes gene_type:complete
MAEITQTRVLPPEFIEAAGKVALGDLATATGQFKTADLSKVFGQQFVAGQDPLQAQAQTLATQGIGAYQPFLNQAQAAQTTAGGLTGPTAFRQFMSPYQQDVIDTTLREFDVQAQKGLPALAAQAINAGAFGGGREGVQRAEYQQASDRNRAALQAQLLQQGFGQAQTAAQQAFLNQQTLGNQQLNLAGQQQAFLGQDVGALSTLGAQNQALQQAQLQAQQQLAQQQLQQPLTAAQTYGQGVTSLIAGYPGQTTQISQPSPSPIATAIGAGGTLAGIYRAFNQPGVLNT